MKTLPVPADAPQMMDLSSLGLPEVPLVGIYRFTAAHGPLADHMHPGLMEICFLKTGGQVYRVGGRDYYIRGNEVFVSFPDEPHGTGKYLQDRGMLYWMQIDPRRRPLLGLGEKESELLSQSLLSLPARHFRGTERMARLFEELLSTLRQPQALLHAWSIRTLLTQWLLTLVECAQRQSLENGVTGDIKKVLRLIAEHPEEPFTIDRLAEHARLSPSRFKAKFKEQTGMPPVDYLMRLRIDRAKTLLEQGKLSITEIAYRLGFSSSQYFATVFKKYTQMRPAQWRQNPPQN